MRRFRVVPLELAKANELVASWHRHHKPVQGHRFSIGAIDAEGKIVGAAIVGRPVSRMHDPLKVLEITRLVTDGTEHACSFLYGAVRRVAQTMGYERVQTFILKEEPGTSLFAAGYEDEGETTGGQWKYADGQPMLFGVNRRTDQPVTAKRRFATEITA